MRGERLAGPAVGPRPLPVRLPQRYLPPRPSGQNVQVASPATEGLLNELNSERIIGFKDVQPGIVAIDLT